MCKSCGGGKKATSVGAKATTVSPVPNSKSSSQTNNTVNLKVTLPNGISQQAIPVKPQFVHLIPVGKLSSSKTAIVVRNETFPVDKKLADELIKTSATFFSIV